MTEEEAKTKRCCGPEGRGVPADWGAGARRCIGSECMAWRWRYKTVTDRVVGLAAEEHKETAAGYCGLAGEP